MKLSQQTRMALGAALALALAACSPQLDWREIKPAEAPVLALMPCKPEHAVRPVPAGHGATQMAVYACTAAGLTFALSVVDVPDPAQLGGVMAWLVAGMRQNFGDTGAAASSPTQAPGMTPHAAAARWQFNGRFPDGSAAQVSSRVVTQGVKVVQSTVYGARLDAAAVKEFEDSLQFLH